MLLDRAARRPRDRGGRGAVDGRAGARDAARRPRRACCSSRPGRARRSTSRSTLVFSNAVFHRVPDHDALFARLFAALRPGGRLVAQCGGAGNIERFHDAVDGGWPTEPPFAEHFEAGRARGTSPPGRDEERLARRRLRRTSTSGSSRARSCRPSRTSTCARSASATTSTQLPDELRDDVRGRRGRALRRAALELDYVRLNIDATEAGVSTARSSPCPATASARRSWPPRASCWPSSGDFELDEHLVGGASIDAHGTALTDEVLDACRAADAVLLAAVGGPEVGLDRPRRAAARSRACSACARASGCSRTCGRSGRARRCSTPARCGRERIEGTDLLVVRELTGGIYFGDRGRNGDSAYDTCVYTRAEIERIAARGLRGSPAARSRASTRRTSSRPRGSGARPSTGWRAEPRRRARAHARGQRRDAAGRRGRPTST